MGGNVKDAMTEEPKVTRECSHCDSEFEDTVKYGPERHCTDCKEKFDDPEYIESSVELDVNEEGQLLVQVTFDSAAPDGLRVRFPGEDVEEGIIFGEITLQSDGGRCEDIICSDEKYMYHDLKIQGSRTDTVLYPDDPKEDVRKKHRSEEGDLFEGDEITVEVEFYCSEVESCTGSLTVPEAVAKNI